MCTDHARTARKPRISRRGCVSLIRAGIATGAAEGRSSTLVILLVCPFLQPALDLCGMCKRKKSEHNTHIAHIHTRARAHTHTHDLQTSWSALKSLFFIASTSSSSALHSGVDRYVPSDRWSKKTRCDLTMSPSFTSKTAFTGGGARPGG